MNTLQTKTISQNLNNPLQQLMDFSDFSVATIIEAHNIELNPVSDRYYIFSLGDNTMALYRNHSDKLAIVNLSNFQPIDDFTFLIIVTGHIQMVDISDYLNRIYDYTVLGDYTNLKKTDYKHIIGHYINLIPYTKDIPHQCQPIVNAMHTMNMNLPITLVDSGFMIFLRHNTNLKYNGVYHLPNETKLVNKRFYEPIFLKKDGEATLYVHFNPNTFFNQIPSSLENVDHLLIFSPFNFKIKDLKEIIDNYKGFELYFDNKQVNEIVMFLNMILPMITDINSISCSQSFYDQDNCLPTIQFTVSLNRPEDYPTFRSELENKLRTKLLYKLIRNYDPMEYEDFLREQDEKPYKDYLSWFDNQVHIEFVKTPTKVFVQFSLPHFKTCTKIFINFLVNELAKNERLILSEH